MTNIILESNGSRPRLLEQTLRTLYENTPADQFSLVVVFDGLPIYGLPPNATFDNSITIWPPCKVTGRLKNLGAYWSEKQFGKSEYVAFIDDDVSFHPGWLEKMIKVMENCKDVRILGGNRHPYHGVNGTMGAIRIHESNGYWDYKIEVVDAVAGYCMLMKWHTWATFGPFDSKAVGIMQGEDVNICQKIVKAGGKVGYIHPPVLEHCGLTNSVGGKATGADQIVQKEGVLYL